MVIGPVAALALLLPMLQQTDSTATPSKEKAPCAISKVDGRQVGFTCDGIDDETAARLLRTLNETLESRAPAADRPAGRAVSQRHLGVLQKQALIQRLKTYSGTTVSILCPAGDQEAQKYAEDYMEVLRSAGWLGLASSRPELAVFGPEVSGVVILINRDDAKNHTAPPQATALLRALKQTGITARGSRDAKVKPGTVGIVVARNPLGSVGVGDAAAK